MPLQEVVHACVCAVLGRKATIREYAEVHLPQRGALGQTVGVGGVGLVFPEIILIERVCAKSYCRALGGKLS